MNKATRKELDAIREQLEGLSMRVEELRDDEVEKVENLPESLQDSERGEALQRSAEYLDLTYDSLQEAISNLESACEV